MLNTHFSIYSLFIAVICIFSTYLSVYWGVALVFLASVILTAFKMLSPSRLFLCIAVITFFTVSSLNTLKNSTPLQSGSFHINVCQPADESEYAYRFLGYASEYSRWGFFYIKKGPNVTRPKYGDRYIASISPKSIRSPSNPGQFDYANYLHSRGISGQYNIVRIHRYLSPDANPIKSMAYILRDKLLRHINDSFPETTAPLIFGLLFGDDAIRLDKHRSALFYRTGLLHLLVVSGSQVTLLNGVLVILLRRITNTPLLIFVSLLITNAIFFVLTGGDASVFRAIIMGLLMLGMQLIHHKAHPLHILSVTALALLCINPFYVFSLGAQLSFLATAALVFISPNISQSLPNKIPSFFRESLAVAIAPTLLSTPLIWYAQSHISLTSIISNVLAVPVVELLVIIGFFSSAIGLLFPVLSIFPNLAIEGLISLLMAIVEINDRFLTFNIFLKRPSISVVGIMTSAIIIGVIYLNTRFRRVSLLGITTYIIIFLVHISLEIFIPRPLTITFLDVGQGDATLIQTPSKHTILIDTGKRSFKKDGFDSGRDIILPALRSMGVNKIDILIITHYDLDHVGGAPYLINKIPIGLLLDNGNRSYHDQAFSDAIKTSNLKHDVAIAKQLYMFDDLAFYIIHPQNKSNAHLEKNNRSVSVLIDYSGHKVLLTGDLEKDGEDILINTFGSFLDATILKVGHHGSNTSSTERFLDIVSPEISIISAGPGNRYGHPHHDVLGRLMHTGSRIYRTDHHGAIQLSFSGGNVELKTFLTP